MDELFLGDITEIKKFNLAANDVLVLRCPEKLPEDVLHTLVERIESFFPGHKAIILDGGAQLDVITQDMAQDMAINAVT